MTLYIYYKIIHTPSLVNQKIRADKLTKNPKHTSLQRLPQPPPKQTNKQAIITYDFNFLFVNKMETITKNYKNHDQAPKRMRTKQSSWNHAIYRAKSQIKCYRKLLMCILWSHSFGFIHLVCVIYGRKSSVFKLRTSVLIPSYDMKVR